jgi:hypothetical protein
MSDKLAAFWSKDTPLSEEQRALIERPIHGETIFLEGPAGAGKTTVGAARLRRLLTSGVPADQILVLAPQRTLLAPYQRVLRSPDLPPGGTVDTLTIGGLARRMVDLFWPLAAERAGFAHPERPPVFLTLETAQYYMARIADPLIDAGAFEEITIERNRLLSQILDNLNKAALVGLDYTQVGERLRLAWAGASARATVYERAQQCANDFRAHCLAHNLLDFALQIEVFVKHLLTLPWPDDAGFMSRFTRYRHLVVDNVEEDTPVTHDLLHGWLPSCDSAVLIYDQDAGLRVFLGADPNGGQLLSQACRHHAELHASFVTTPDLRRLGYEMARSLRQTPPPLDRKEGDLRGALVYNETPLRFHPQMLDWVTAQIARLVHEQGVPPGQIAVVAPFLSDALRFSLSDRLEQRGIATLSHRPSRALRDEPAARCLLTLAALAHPQWGLAPPRADVAHALALAIDTLDLVRAQLLTDIVYRPQSNIKLPQEDGARDEGEMAAPRHHHPLLSPFADLKTGAQERIGYQAGNRYDALRDWLYQDAQLTRPSVNGAGRKESTSTRYQHLAPPIDHFFSRLFGEVLSQPGYGFHRDFQAGRITAQLIESARKFRQVARQPAREADPNNSQPNSHSPPHPTGLEYVRLVQQGVIAAQYIPAWGRDQEEENAVLLAPAYTFLMRNRSVDYQFWLNAGSGGWWERLYQPLTHPHVLTRHWRHGEVWTDAHEVEAQTQALHRLVQGLIRRCRGQIYLGISELGEQGYEQRGPLLKAIQGALRRRGVAREQPGA